MNFYLFNELFKRRKGHSTLENVSIPLPKDFTKLLIALTEKKKELKGDKKVKVVKHVQVLRYLVFLGVSEMYRQYAPGGMNINNTMALVLKSFDPKDLNNEVFSKMYLDNVETGLLYFFDSLKSQEELSNQITKEITDAISRVELEKNFEVLLKQMEK